MLWITTHTFWKVKSLFIPFHTSWRIFTQSFPAIVKLRLCWFTVYTKKVIKIFVFLSFFITRKTNHCVQILVSALFKLRNTEEKSHGQFKELLRVINIWLHRRLIFFFFLFPPHSPKYSEDWETIIKPSMQNIYIICAESYGSKHFSPPKKYWL